MGNKKYIVIVACILIVFVILLGPLGSLARYVSNSVWNYYLQSKEFYFSSDYLATDKKSNTNKQWDGGSVQFNVKNTLNDGVATNYDITYKAVCTLRGVDESVARCVINDTDSNTFNGTLSNYNVCVNNKNDGVDVSGFNKTECEVKGYSWVLDVTDKDLSFSIVGEKLDNVVADVVVTSLSPYKKVLSGEFILVRDENSLEKISSLYRSYPDYGELVVSNSYNSDKCVSIKWDSSKIKFDYDKDIVKSFEKDSNDYINSIKVSISKNNSAVYRFYSSTTDKIDLSSFTIDESSC